VKKWAIKAETIKGASVPYVLLGGAVEVKSDVDSSANVFDTPEEAMIELKRIKDEFPSHARLHMEVVQVEIA
jgi:hypothetical protein